MTRSSFRKLRGDAAGALADADHAVAAWPHSYLALITRVGLRHMQNDFAGAMADLKVLQTLYPDDGRLWGREGDLWVTQSDFYRALAAYDEDLRRSPGHAGLLRGRAQVLEIRKNVEGQD